MWPSLVIIYVTASLYELRASPVFQMLLLPCEEEEVVLEALNENLYFTSFDS